MNRYILAAIQTLLQDERHPPGRALLDLSVGTGVSSVRYRELGFDVTTTAFDPATVTEPDLDVLRVDLHAPLPFPDASFELVCLQEVIEHLHNIPAVLSEVQRVLRPGGTFILTTPNMLCMRSRVRFLFTGFFRGRARPIAAAKSGNAPNWNILPFHVWWWLAEQHGFGVEATACARVDPGSIAATVLLYPLVVFSTRRRCGGQEALLRKMLSRDVLWSENLVMKWARG